MQQMCRYWISGVFLSICSWQDIRTKELSGKLLLLFGIIAVIVDIYSFTSIFLCITGCMPGLMLLLIGKITGEQIGYGDGFAVMILGLLILCKETISALMWGFFLCSCIGILLLFRNLPCIGKNKKRERIPFLPFLTVGFLFSCLMKG